MPGTFDEKKHLFDYERKLCERRGWNKHTYFSNLDERIRQARLSKGRPIRAASEGKAFSFSMSSSNRSSRDTVNKRG